MTRKVLVIALAITVFGGLGSAFADDTPCGNYMLHGSYGFTIDGIKLAGNGPVGPQKGVAMAQFNGNGSFTQTDTVVIDGIVVADYTHTPANGTYTVNSDCTGDFTIIFTDGRPPVTTNFIVVNNGKEIDTVVTTVAGNQGILITSSVGKKVH
jgi:hypothetical protein